MADPVVRITVQPGLTANGEPTTNPLETIPYANISFDDPWAYIIQVTRYDPVNFELPPVTRPDKFTTGRNADLIINTDDLISNDYLPKFNNTLTFTGFTQPDNGSIVDSGNGFITYLPANNFFGSDSFEYTVSNEVGSSTGKVKIKVIWSVGILEANGEIVAIENEPDALQVIIIKATEDTVTFDIPEKFVVEDTSELLTLEI